jgi:hypothetical protein
MTEEFPRAEYQSFMENYVRRINEATLNVRFGGVRIGDAKYTRLAQINLKTKVITFSRYAIENVPERGRRYLVLHELAHVREANHNRRFWSMVAKYEPDYRRIGREIQNAFTKNVEEQDRREKELARLAKKQGAGLMQQLSLFSGFFPVGRAAAAAVSPAKIAHTCTDELDDSFAVVGATNGVIHGGTWLYESDDSFDDLEL